MAGRMTWRPSLASISEYPAEPAKSCEQAIWMRKRLSDPRAMAVRDALGILLRLKLQWLATSAFRIRGNVNIP